MPHAALTLIHKEHTHPYQRAFGTLLLACALPLLWWVSQPSNHTPIDQGQFLFWHSMMEMCSVVVAMLVFVTGYRAILSVRKGAVVLLGITFLGVGLLDFLHTMSYAGMPNAVSANSAQKSIFFWLAARSLAAVSLMIFVMVPAIPRVSLTRKRSALLTMLLVVCLLGYFGLFTPDRLPMTFIEGKGLTPLKIGLEWCIITLNLLTAFALWCRRKALANECVMALILAALLSAVSEMFVTMLGIVDKDMANLLGHIYKVAAYLFLFHATFNEALRRPLERIEVQNVREKLVLSAAPDGVLWVNQEGQILMSNPAMDKLAGYPAGDLVGQNVDIFLPPQLRVKHANSMRGFFIEQHARAMGSVELRLMRRDGTMLPVDISLGYWEDENEKHAIAYVRDLTERKGFEESLRHRATHDQLTGLPNRWLFNLQLDQSLAHAKRCERRVATLFLDLDDFKNVNDTFGHGAGDELLTQVGKRLRNILRENDTLARLGGDEFAVLLADLNSVEEATTVAEKLLICLDAPYHVQNQEVLVGGSIGLAFYPDDAQDSQNLVRFADMAMYQAKRSGRGAYACYSAQLNQSAHENMQIHIRLKDAISHGTLRLLYQPQVDVNTGAIVGAEALLRWNDSLLGDVSPARFIPVAESTGLILPLSDWVLETACKQIAAWSRQGMPLRVAVNFSAHQFRQGNLPGKVSAALQRTGAAPHLLEVEITESIAMTHPVLAREQLDALVALGCRVALDDFGTGYSSLAYLKALPVAILKIDRGFIKDIPSDLSDMKISRSIIALAHSLGLQIVAEGVETDHQLGFLRNHGCETYQGWLFAKALEADDLTARYKASDQGVAKHRKHVL